MTQKREIQVSETHNGLPFVYIDDFFPPEDVDKILAELERIRPHFEGPEDTAGAVTEEGKHLKKNLGLFHHKYYATPIYSDIFMLTRQYYKQEFLDELKSKSWFLRYLDTNLNAFDSLQMLYYENSDNYESHVDAAAVTILYWVHKQPKAFTGGDLILEEKTHFEMKHNRVFMFPSIMRHKVTPVSMLEEKDGYGRYCISNFVHTKTYDTFEPTKGKT
jgi:hypothetical protein